MTALLAQHYRANYERLSREPVIIAMAQDTIEKPMPFKLCHDGTNEPTHEFMMTARAAYWRAFDENKASTPSDSIGAAAEAVLIARRRILDALDNVRAAATVYAEKAAVLS